MVVRSELPRTPSLPSVGRGNTFTRQSRVSSSAQNRAHFETVTSQCETSPRVRSIFPLCLFERQDLFPSPPRRYTSKPCPEEGLLYRESADGLGGGSWFQGNRRRVNPKSNDRLPPLGGGGTHVVNSGEKENGGVPEGQRSANKKKSGSVEMMERIVATCSHNFLEHSRVKGKQNPPLSLEARP